MSLPDRRGEIWHLTGDTEIVWVVLRTEESGKTYTCLVHQVTGGGGRWYVQTGVYGFQDTARLKQVKASPVPFPSEP